MKNQYVGDIGDYGKYSLLRDFAEAGVKVGINWYLTEDDGSNDGKFVDYLKKGEMRADLFLRWSSRQLAGKGHYGITRIAGLGEEYYRGMRGLRNESLICM